LFLLHDPPTTALYTLSLHDALPICSEHAGGRSDVPPCFVMSRIYGVADPRLRFKAKKKCMDKVHSGDSVCACVCEQRGSDRRARSEEHTSELQSRGHLVCRLLLEKK